MGLDMYAHKVAKCAENTDVSYNEDAIADNDFFYWRKNNALHGWMHRLYTKKGGTEHFNCVPVRLTIEDLDNLKEDIENARMKPTEGFFFGAQTYSDFDRQDDLAFIEKAKEVLQKGIFEIYYTSWW